MPSASSTTSPSRVRVIAREAGREKSISSRIVPLDPVELAAGQVELFRRVGVGPAALEHLHQRAERRQRVAHLVGDARGQQAERGHLLLLDHPGLRGPQGVGPLGDPLLQLGPDPHQLRVQILQLVSGRPEQTGQ